MAVTTETALSGTKSVFGLRSTSEGSQAVSQQMNRSIDVIIRDRYNGLRDVLATFFLIAAIYQSTRDVVLLSSS